MEASRAGEAHSTAARRDADLDAYNRRPRRRVEVACSRSFRSRPERARAATIAEGEKTMAKSRKPMSVHDLWALKRVGPPTLSPDGGIACASVTSYDMDENEGRTELWLFP